MCMYILFPVVLGIIVIILSYHPEIGPDSLLSQQIVIDFFHIGPKIARLGQFCQNCENDYFYAVSRGIRNHYNHF